MLKRIPLKDIVMHEDIARFSHEFKSQAHCRAFLLQAQAEGCEVIFSKTPPQDDPPRPKSYVYFVLCREAGRLKIGYSDAPVARIERQATFCPFPIETLRIVEGGRALERRLHIRFANLRRNLEWFEATAELLEFVTTFEPNEITDSN